MELKRDEIIKALEWCSELRLCVDCPMRAEGYFSHSGNACRKAVMENALALIKSQEQKIFELENRLKECENGYEGTLYLDRCKLHDAEKRIISQREEIRRLQNRIHNLTQSLKAHREKAEGLGVQLHEVIAAHGAERCLLCDDIIPEGRQICPNCEKGVTIKNEK